MTNALTTLMQKTAAVAHADILMGAKSKIAKYATFGLTIFSVALLTTAPDALAGGSNLKEFATDVSDKTTVIPNMLSYASYIAGAGLAILGLGDIKKHVENPAQNPIRGGVGKLAFGGLLLALPYVLTVMGNTMGNLDEQGGQYGKFELQGI